MNNLKEILKEAYELNNRHITYLQNKLDKEAGNLLYSRQLDKALRSKRSMEHNAKIWGISLE